ncbi:MAG: pantoate--beta-alanine ligase [Candidatus Omnitrophica bacterium]|nr:pantoate--beta-alanine ligase [Candidatus Omnitrophota bacterium]
MKIVNDPVKAQKIIKELKLKRKSIGLVPTMGALHEGHLSLIRSSCKENDFTVVSIFVNPVQFGPKEDLNKYPRPIKNDLVLCKKAGVDLVFHPMAENIYPQGYKTWVTVDGLSKELCGKSRPVHFRGVTTVVAKLFNIIQPDAAYFGQKDAQQAVIIEKMTQDLNFLVKIQVMPTVRERDGLALSSRNIYLNKQERQDALVLQQVLDLAKSVIKSGERNTQKVIFLMRRFIEHKNSAKIDYIEIVDCNNLLPVKIISGKCLVALAVWIGKTRLIDNVIVTSNR